MPPFTRNPGDGAALTRRGYSSRKGYDEIKRYHNRNFFFTALYVCGPRRGLARRALRADVVMPRAPVRCVGVLREFSFLVVFVVSRFVFSVSPSGVCAVVSRRSGRRLSGAALSACLSAVLRSVRSSVFLPAWASGRGVAVVRSGRCFLRGVLVSGVRGVVAAARAALLPVPASLFSSRFALLLGCLSALVSARSRGVAASARVARVAAPVLASCGCVLPPSPSPVPPSLWSALGLPPVPGLPGASGSGSAVWLLAPGVLSAVAAGRCPVSLALEAFSAWPLRSAVLWALFVVLRSPAGVAFVRSAACRPVAVAFVRSALSSLGFSVSGRWFAGRSVAALRFLSRRSVALPAPFAALSGSGSRAAVVSALSALSRCLRFVALRSSSRVSCPRALRPALASLASLLLGALSL